MSRGLERQVRAILAAVVAAQSRGLRGIGDLPVVRRLNRLEHFEEVRQYQNDQPLGQVSPGTAEVG